MSGRREGEGKDMNEGWVVVRVVNGSVEGSIIKGKLESEGIPVVLRQEAVGRIYGLTVDGLGRTEVMVPPSLKDLALEILAPADAGGEDAG